MPRETARGGRSGAAASRWLRAAVLAAVALCAGALLPVLPAGPMPEARAQSAEQTERELAEVRRRIEALQRDQQRRSERRDATLRELRRAETAAGDVGRQLAGTRDELTAASRQVDELEAQREQALVEAGDARDALVEQMRMTYFSGRQEGLRLLLNQEDPARLGRMLVYYDYLTRHRGERLEALMDRLAEVRRLTDEAVEARERLAALERRQRSELDELESARDRRQAAVAQIDAEIAAAGGELDSLRAQEEELTDLIERLRRELADFPADPQTPFASLQGELPWPVRGSQRHGFGQGRGDGGMNWNGVLLDADRGATVRAVHHGRVVFADWLQGMGLLMVLDHGGGYMSLYGHNETLLREPGEWVSPGDPIAEVGDTGGQNRSGLYFEIRREGRPINPAPWMRGTPEP